MAQQTDHKLYGVDELRKQAADLLSQQIWCWGRDILRAEGNWLLETGFERIEAPADRENCSSVYSLELPPNRRVVLRGFGVFYGDDEFGSVFLKRYDFRPRYSINSTLERPPWSDADLPKFDAPDASQRDACASLTVSLIDWIQSYEAAIVDELGIRYRQSTLDEWNTGKQPIVPAEKMACTWRSLGVAVAASIQTEVPRC